MRVVIDTQSFVSSVAAVPVQNAALVFAIARVDDPESER